tara:strand:+ start:620 stop:1075 length:456 start_codon:yes stop_codon:yes gene_type:complete
MDENNLQVLSVYTEKRNTWKALFVGTFCISLALDTISFGYLRGIVEQKILLHDFGQNAREEFLIYLVLAVGIYLVLYFLVNRKEPIISIYDKTIKLRTSKYMKPLKKEIEDLIYYEFSSYSKILFHFKDGTISVDIDNVNRENLMKALDKI